MFVLLLHEEGDDDVDGSWANSVISNDVIALVLTNSVVWENSPNFRMECGYNDSRRSNFQ